MFSVVQTFAKSKVILKRGDIETEFNVTPSAIGYNAAKHASAVVTC